MVTRNLRSSLRFILVACGSNTALLLFYWVAIFPRTRGWIAWKDVPLLFALNLVGGALAGVVVSLLERRIPLLSGIVSRRQTDVWTR